MTTGVNILNPALRGQLFAIQRTQSAIDQAQLRLATGNEVNTALDNPNNFFGSKALDNRASDLERLLDNIGQNLQVIEAADNALRATEALLLQAQALVDELYLDLTNQTQSLSEIILEDNPAAYWRLNEVSGTTAQNLGSGGAALDGLYNEATILGADPLYIGKDNDSAADFQASANNEFVRIADSPLINTDVHDERTIELIFNADHTNGRQVLYEEGGTVNALNIYIEDGELYVNGRDSGAWGFSTPNPFASPISAEIEAGETYHVALVFDFAGDRTFKGFLNGEEIGSTNVTAIFPNHGANIGIGGMHGDSYFHDGPVNGNGLNFNGRISDVALYNDVLSADDIQERYAASSLQQSRDAETELNAVLNQLDLVTADATYRGTNLLEGDNLITYFNEDRSSSLTTVGKDFSALGLGINTDADFNRIEEVEDAVEEIREALIVVRNYSTTLANDFAVLSTREDFIGSMVNDLQKGSDLLTVADQNEEGANLLALQTRQQVQFSVLSFNSNAASIANFLI